MATINGIYKVKNSEGTYDVINLRTTAEQVVESSSKRFVTDAEKSTWNSKANATHTHTSAQVSDATNANTANMIVKRDDSGNFSAGTITANLAGNASTATTLSAARTINGTSFNGSTNITTAIWGTARNITIGNAKKSVNGSADVSFSLSEIGAATTSHTHNYAGSSSAGGAANSAVKLATARTITLGNQLSGSTSFDGSGNVTLNAKLNYIQISSGDLNTYINDGLYRCISLGESNNVKNKPIDTADAINGFVLKVERMRNVSNTDANVKQIFSWGTRVWERVGTISSDTTWTNWRELAFTDSSITGNSATATRLATARTINGTNFDGTSNIITSNWGTARTITIGATAKSVNGSANMSWTLAEIGAAASSHTHNYAGSSSAGGAANTAIKLNTARTINGVSFDGTANITIKADPNSHTHTSSEISGLGSAATKNTGTASGQIPILGTGGKLPTSVLPSVTINNTHTVETVAAALNLGCDVGDIVIITSFVQPANLLKEVGISEETQRALNSGSNTFICVNSSASTFDAKFKVLMSSSDAVTHAELNSQLATKANTSHNHDSAYLKLSGGTVTGNVAFNNNVGVQAKNTSGSAYDIAKINSSNQTYLGTESLPTIIASSSNPQAKVGSNSYTLYHTGNKPSASDIGALTQSIADSRYKLKSDLVFTDTISVITPAS